MEGAGVAEVAGQEALVDAVGVEGGVAGTVEPDGGFAAAEGDADVEVRAGAAAGEPFGGAGGAGLESDERPAAARLPFAGADGDADAVGFEDDFNAGVDVPAG